MMLSIKFSPCTSLPQAMDAATCNIQFTDATSLDKALSGRQEVFSAVPRRGCKGWRALRALPTYSRSLWTFL
eukprot:6487573-Amphidinium_carterae.1